MAREGRGNQAFSLTNIKRGDTDMITMEEFNQLKGAMEDAQTDDTPFISTTDEEIHVFGNPNKTEVVTADYSVLFAFPNTDEWQRRIKKKNDTILGLSGDGKYVKVERKYNNVFLSPRNMSNAVTAMMLVEQFMYAVNEDGTVREFNEEEVKSLIDVMNHELCDATYELVGTVLRIPYEEREWMLPLNTVENAVKIVANNPTVVNEADVFFG